MTEQHPITPLPELVKQWWKDAQRADYSDGLPCWLNYVATQAARWGADQELEACCEWVSENVYRNHPFSSHELRTARRPKPPSLKEQALEVLERCCFVNPKHENIIRHALEALPE